MPEYSVGRLARPDGSPGYCVYWWEDGKRRRFRLEASSLKEAEAEAIDVARQEKVKAVGSTIAELWEAYRAEKAGRRIADAMKHEWKAIGPYFGHLRPDQVTIEMCRAYAARRRLQKPKGKKTGTHDGTIWTELGHLRTMFIWAVQRKKIDHAPSIERPQKPAPKSRYLSDSEVAKLLSVDMEPHIKLAILLMLSTAGRVGAILDLTWDRVDFERGQVDLKLDAVGPTKGRATVPMNAGLRAALQTAKSVALSEFVVEWGGKQIGSIKTGFNNAVKAAGLKKVTPHTLRHTAAVKLASEGVSMQRISQYLGHSNSQITERVYAKFAPEHLRQEAEILDFTKLRMVK